MSQTDRQTDKATWWSVTAFAEDEIRELSGTEFPRFVKKVFGGMEKCPTSGRLHFQGAIQCHSQQRFSALKKWLKTSHLEVARNEDAIRQYAMKEDTAVGPKREAMNTTPYAAMHDLLTQVATRSLTCGDQVLALLDVKKCKSIDDEYREEFIYVTRLILQEQPSLVTAFMIPAVERAWIRYRGVWIARALVLQAQASEEADLLDEISRQDETPQNIFVPMSTEDGSALC